MQSSMTTQTKRFCLFILVSSLSFSPSAFAYLDPSTSSMIISAIIGLFASIVLAVKTYWHRLMSFFRGNRKQPTERPAQGIQTDSEQ